MGDQGTPVGVQGFDWNSASPNKLDQVRCDTMTTFASPGCVFVNSAPTYTFNAGKYPQAAAHAWLIQTKAPKTPGLQSANTPLYYMSNASQKKTSRARICPSGWAASNGDPSALDSSNPNDALNCDEFPFASTYNSGGMATSEGGLNQAVPYNSATGVPNGSACVQTYATKVDGVVHLYNINGYVPSWTEVCGRSAMSGAQNQGSMNRVHSKSRGKTTSGRSPASTVAWSIERPKCSPTALKTARSRSGRCCSA